MTTPAQIQDDIERTRASLSADVDMLGNKVSPTKVVGRRVDRVRGTATSVRERIMGSKDEGSGVLGVGTSTSETVRSAASGVAEAASSAPERVRSQAQGNPLAAGLIAFGVGWLASSVIPASSREREMARRVEDKAAGVAEPLKEGAQEIAGNLQEPLQQSAQQVSAAAKQAAVETKDEAKSAAQEVKQSSSPGGGHREGSAR